MSFQTIKSIKIDKPVLLPAPRKNRPDRKETYYPVVCLYCGETRYLRQSDYNPNALCKSCASIASKLGGSHVSYDEERIRDILVELGYSVYWQYPLYEYHVLIDLYIIELDLYVEVNGYWHNETRQERDYKLLQSLPNLLIINHSITLPELLEELERYKKHV
jgi:hypothetical protein